MRRFAIALLALAALLAACETTPPQKFIPGHALKSSHEVRLDPLRAAACLARNIDSKRPALDARIRPGHHPVSAEVHISSAKPIVLAQVLASTPGSTVVIFTAPELGQPREELVTAMLEGC